MLKASEMFVVHHGSKLVSYDSEKWLFLKNPPPFSRNIEVFINNSNQDIKGYYNQRIVGLGKHSSGKTYLQHECSKYKGSGITAKLKSIKDKKFCEVKVTLSTDRSKTILLTESEINFGKKKSRILQSISFDYSKKFDSKETSNLILKLAGGMK